LPSYPCGMTHESGLTWIDPWLGQCSTCALPSRALAYTPARLGKARRGTAQRARELAERAVPHFRLGPEGRAYTNMQSRV
jgi:hypothetical protein